MTSYKNEQIPEKLDWQAQWISPDQHWDQGPEGPTWRMSKCFNIEEPIRKALAFYTARGTIDLYINDHLVDDFTLVPGFSSYKNRTLYAAVDVTAHLREGLNGIGVEVADGWWRGRWGFDGGVIRAFGEEVAALLQIEVTLADGSTQLLLSDETWSAWATPRERAQLYSGEEYDARFDHKDWTTRNEDEGAERYTVTARPVRENLVYTPQRLITKKERLEPQSVKRLKDGSLLVDFGQNAAGRLSFAADLADGERLVLKHAEVLEDGKLYRRTLRQAASVDVFFGDGNGMRPYEPRFTTHGFRYALFSGAAEKVDVKSIRFEVLRSDIDLTATFESSSDLLNQLFSNVCWSMRSNFASLPTDCPQRDERMGWTGDIQVFGPTALMLGDCVAFLSDWLEDVRAEQVQYGAVPLVVPWAGADNGFWSVDNNHAIWDDVASLLPWALYQQTGDKALLEKHWRLLKTWTDQLITREGKRGLWKEGMQLGDWLDPAAPPDNPAAGTTDPQLVANAYRVRTIEVAAKVAALLGKPEAEHYKDEAQVSRQAFRTAYIDKNGMLSSDSQTAYTLAINGDLFDTDEERLTAAKRLEALVRENGYRIGTGFAGTPEICDALSKSGNMETAYKLLEQTECPSWGYPITMGATTIWERWDSMLPDGTVNPGGMTSFNHYALGSVLSWIFRKVLGIQAVAPGYAKVEIAPHPGGTLTFAQGGIETPHGRITVEWKLEDEHLVIAGEIPDGVEATLKIEALKWTNSSGKQVETKAVEQPLKAGAFTCEI